MPISPDRVVLTSGTSEGIELALGALADAGDEVLVPTPTYPLYTAVLAQDRRARRLLPDRSANATGCRISTTCKRLHHAAPRARSSSIDPNNPTGAVYPEATRRALIDLADAPGVPILADEVYGDLGFDGPVPLLGSLAPDAPIISFSSLSKAYLAPGWRAGLAGGRPIAIGSTTCWRRSRSWPTAGCAVRARCSTPSPRRSRAIDRTSASSCARCGCART